MNSATHSADDVCRGPWDWGGQGHRGAQGEHQRGPAQGRGVPAGPVISSLAGAKCIFSHDETEERWAEGARRYAELSHRSLRHGVMSLHDNWAAKERAVKRNLAKLEAPEIDPEQASLAPYGQDWASGSDAGKEWAKTQRNVRPKSDASEHVKGLAPWRRPRSFPNKYHPLEIPTEKARPRQPHGP